MGIQGGAYPDPGNARCGDGHCSGPLPSRGDGVLVNEAAGGCAAAAGGNEHSGRGGGLGDLQRRHLGLHRTEGERLLIGCLVGRVIVVGGWLVCCFVGF